MARKISPFLMFEGRAEDAMRFYVSLFPGSEVIRLERYGPGEPGSDGSVKRADFVLAGQAVICIDSPVKHAFTFTPSMSLYAECESEAEFDSAMQPQPQPHEHGIRAGCEEGSARRRQPDSLRLAFVG